MFVLCAEWSYEGEGVLGVYASLEDAIAAAGQTEWGDCRLIYEVEVGAAPELNRELVWYSDED